MTPGRTYQILAENFGKSVPWSHVHFFWGDERATPPTLQDSNFRLAWDSLLSRIEIPSENIHRIETDFPDPQSAALVYETQLREFFSKQGLASPRFDLVLLGVGENGHTGLPFSRLGALSPRDRSLRVLGGVRMGSPPGIFPNFHDTIHIQSV